MLMKRCKQWLLAGMLWSLCAAALAETVFEWTDADGVKHFSSKPPPPGVQANEKQVMPMPMVGTVAPQLAMPSEGLPEEDSVSRERAELARQRIAATSYEEALAVECDHARGVLGKLRANQNIVLTDDSGNSRAMPEPERNRRVQLASDFIRDNCR
jgi:hypothetical protein